MILVYADHDRGELDPLALQVVSAARGLDADVHALIVGPNAEKCVDDLASVGVRTVLMEPARRSMITPLGRTPMR